MNQQQHQLLENLAHQLFNQLLEGFVMHKYKKKPTRRKMKKRRKSE